MEKKQVLVGLDLGTDKVRIAAGVASPLGKVTLLGVGEVPCEGIVRASIVNIDKTVEAIQEAARMVSAQAGIHIKIANVSITGGNITSEIHHSGITKEATNEEITEKDVIRLNKDMYRLVTPLPGNEIIHMIPRQYSVDQEGGVKAPIGMSGVRLEGDFQVITAQTNAINNIYKCTKRAGIEVDNLIFAPLAASIAALTEDEKKEGVCLLDIGASVMGLTIYQGGTLHHSAVIPFGSECLTTDLAQAFMLMEPQAKQLKERYGTTYEEQSQHAIVTVPGAKNRPEKELYLPLVSRVIEARMEENVAMIQAEIAKAGCQNKLLAGIVLTGGGAKLGRLAEFFQYTTGYLARVGDPAEYLATDSSVFPDVEFTTALGLILANNKVPDYSEQYVKERHKELTKGGKSLENEAGRGGFWSKLKSLFITDHHEQT